MSVRRAVALTVAALLVLLGGLWTAQGYGWVGGSSMSGNHTWAVIGPLVAGLGVALCIVVLQGARRH